MYIMTILVTSYLSILVQTSQTMFPHEMVSGAM